MKYSFHLTERAEKNLQNEGQVDILTYNDCPKNPLATAQLKSLNSVTMEPMVYLPPFKSQYLEK